MRLVLPRTNFFVTIKGDRVKDLILNAIQHCEDNPYFDGTGFPVLDEDKVFEISGPTMSLPKAATVEQIHIPVTYRPTPEENECRLSKMYFGEEMSVTDEETVLEGDYSIVSFPEPDPEPVVPCSFTVHEDDEIEEEDDDSIHFSDPVIPVPPPIIKSNAPRTIRPSFQACRRLNKLD